MTAFSGGARAAFKLREKDLRSMLSRRQLQGFVGLRVARFYDASLSSHLDLIRRHKYRGKIFFDNLTIHHPKDEG
jgi:hypothetical protein